MCRMVGVSAGEPVEVLPYIEGVKEMALSGMRAPHGDGWGVAYLDGNGEIKVYRSTRPIWEDDLQQFENLRSSLFLVHARKASIGAVQPENIHPFVVDSYAFAHNGTEKARLCLLNGVMAKGDTDSERIFLHLLKRENGEGFARAYRALLDMGLRNLTSILIDGNSGTLHAFRCSMRLPGYYTLHYRVEDGVAAVSSEPLEGKWTLLGMGEFASFRRGTCVEKVAINPGCLQQR